MSSSRYGRPRRLWFWGPRQTWNRFRVFRGADECCNPTICFYTPLGALIVVTARELRTEPCYVCTHGAAL